MLVLIKKRLNLIRQRRKKDKLNVSLKYKKTPQSSSESKLSINTWKNKRSYTETQYTNNKKINPTNNPAVKKKISKSASKIIKKASKAKKGTGMVKAVEFSFKSIKGLLIALGSSGAALLAFVIIIGAILLMVASPFSILLDDNPETMRQKINEYYSEYRKEIKNSIEKHYEAIRISEPDYNPDYDNVRIIGASPDIKEVLMLYIVRNDENPDGDVLIDTEEFDINKFKSAFKDLNEIDKTPTVTEYTHQETRKAANGKEETITVLDSRDIIFTQRSETALHYAIRTEMTENQINTIKELSDPEYDKAWESLLYGIQQFSYIIPGTMPYFNQGDYSYISYGPGTLASDGCGPTAFAMVVSYLKGKRITPPEIIKWCGNDYYAWPDNGTMWSFFPDAAEHYGIRCESDVSFDQAVQALKNPDKNILSVEFTVDGESVDAKYKYESVPFHRIRRVTGYLVGDLDRFNDAKRAEVNDRVKHTLVESEPPQL